MAKTLCTRLPDREEVFCQEYARSKNGVKAGLAISTSSSEAVAAQTAYRLLQKPRVKTRIREIQDDIWASSSISADRIIRELGRVAFADYSDYVTVDGSGCVIPKAFEDMPEGASAVIREVVDSRVIAQQAGEGKEMILKAEMKLKLHDKVKALETLAKWKGLLIERYKHDGLPQRIVLRGADGNIISEIGVSAGGSND
jgi:phage terminase small subunit